MPLVQHKTKTIMAKAALKGIHKMQATFDQQKRDIESQRQELDSRQQTFEAQQRDRMRQFDIFAQRQRAAPSAQLPEETPAGQFASAEQSLIPFMSAMISTPPRTPRNVQGDLDTEEVKSLKAEREALEHQLELMQLRIEGAQREVPAQEIDGGDSIGKAKIQFMPPTVPALQLAETLAKKEATTSTIRTKEADSIKLDGMPSVANFRRWKMSFRKEVAGASGRPKEAFRWVCQIEIAESMEDLALDDEFEPLDAKLSAALGKILHGELGR
jgi:hypothetical protein